MTAKPMTSEEIDLLYNLAPRKTGVDQPIVCVGQESFDRLIATARLAPVWRKGTHVPPIDGRSVYAVFPGNDWGIVYWTEHGGWRRTHDSRPTTIPTAWCDLPAPPMEDDRGAAPTQKGGGE